MEDDLKKCEKWKTTKKKGEKKEDDLKKIKKWKTTSKKNRRRTNHPKST